MKKLYTTPAYKAYHARHLSREAKRRLKSVRKRERQNRYNAEHPQADTRSNHTDRTRHPKAPANFCIKENPEEVIKFVNTLTRYLKERTPVFVDLSDIEKISHDAIVILLSIMYQFKKRKISFNGNFPSNEICRKILTESGFLGQLYDKPSIRYDTSEKDKNVIRKHGNDTSVDIAKDLIGICTENIWGQPCRCQGVYRILVELMQNTHTHANRDREGAEDWWLSVNYDAKTNKECFSFVDYGIGIFTSLKNKKSDDKLFGIFDGLWRKISEPSNAKILKYILDKELHKTTTGKPYRGKGLPCMKDALDRNQISNLYIITNDAYADVCANNFVSLSHTFEGTFIYWELTSENKKCHDSNA